MSDTEKKIAIDREALIKRIDEMIKKSIQTEVTLMLSGMRYDAGASVLAELKNEIQSGAFYKKEIVSEREKTIAEIREALEKIDRGDFFEIVRAHEKSGEWLRFLLSELEKRDEENQKLRKELDKQVEIGFSFECQLQSAQQEIEQLQEENEGRKKIIEAYMRIEHDLAEDAERYLQQRDKLIEGLRWYADTKNYEYRTSYLDQDAPILDDCGQRARDILREIGVTVE